MPTRSRRSSPAGDERVIEALTPRFLRGWQLPRPPDDAASDAQGRVLVIAGSAERPGAAVLAATAALRAGAGRIIVATPQSVASAVGVAVPEARIMGLPETEQAGVHPDAAERLAELANSCQATLVGPGLLDEAAIQSLLVRLLPALRSTALVLDAEAALAAAACPDELYDLKCPVVLTPTLGELATMMEEPTKALADDFLSSARRGAARYRAVLVLRGADTVIADSDGRVWRSRKGSGRVTADTLAGLIAGLAARGAELAQAASWGVYLHAAATERLAATLGPVGTTAQELMAEIPALMAELSLPESTPRQASEGRARARRTGRGQRADIRG